LGVVVVVVVVLGNLIGVRWVEKMMKHEFQKNEIFDDIVHLRSAI